MKKITLLLLLLFISFTGYSQLEGFENTTGPDALPSTNWPLGSGDWAVFDNGVGTAQRWGITTTATQVYAGTNSAFMTRDNTNLGAGGVAEDYLASPLVTVPTNGELHFWARSFQVGTQGTLYQVKIAVAPNPQASPSSYLLAQQYTEAQLSATFNVYEEKVVDLSLYAGMQVYIAFVMVNTQTGANPNSDRWFIDNVDLVERCDAPTGGTAGSITQTSATLSWTGTAPQYEIEIIPAAGTFTGTGTLISTTSYAATATTAGALFTPTTSYSYRVRAICSSGAHSAWTPTINFATTSPGLSCAAPITIDNLLYTTTDNTSAYGDNTDVAQPTGCAGGATNYMAGNEVFYAYTAPANGTISVTMTPTAANSSLFVYDGCANVGVACVGGVADTGTGVRSLPNIPVVAGQQYIIVVSSSAVTQTVGYTLVVQNVACAQPATLSASGVSQTAANLSWAAGAATSWEVVVQGAGSGVPTGSGIQTNINTNYPTPALLTANTPYEFYVRADCNDGNGNFSAWSGPYLFRTLCDAFPVPFQEGYNSTSTTQNCWTVVNGNNDGDSWNMDYVTTPFEGDQVAVLLTDGNGGANDDWLISPQVILNGNQRLRYRYKVQSATEPNDFRVMLSTNGASTVDFTTTLVPLATYSNITYAENIVNLSAYSGPVNIAFHVPGGGLDGWRLFIDNFIIEDLPTCPEPSAIASSNVLSTSATITWTNGNTETAWQVLYLPCTTATPAPDATGFIDVPLPGSPFNLTGLTSATCYDVYVRAVCPGNDLSPWSGPTTFTTQVAPPVCNGNFVDPGGINADYASSTDSTVTICPDNIGDLVTVTFTSFFTEATWDGLYVFDGDGIDDPQIASTNPPGNVPGGLAGSFWGNLTGNNIPGPFTSSDISGCLTFRFRSDTSVTDPGWVANVTCGPPPTCRRPVAVNHTTVTTNTAIITWLQPVNPDNSIATAWQVLALPCGTLAPAADATGYVDVAMPGSPYLLTGLTPNTCYDVYVRAVCSDTDSSTWSAATSFTTIPGCGGTFTDLAGATANYANGSNSIVTICPDDAGDVVTVTFTSFNTEANWDGLLVYDGDSTTAPQIASANGTGNGLLSTLPGSYWGNLTGPNIPGPFTSSSVNGCLTFRFISDASFNNPGWVSNVTCAPAPTCPKPTLLTANNITATSAELGWTEQNPNVTHWQVYLVLQGEAAPLQDATTGWVTVATNPATFTGLLPGTQYTFYVRSVCPDGSNSLWSQGFTFATLIINDDCDGAIFAPVNSSAVCQQIAEGTITGATASTPAPEAPCVGVADDDVWFQFVATNPYLNVALQNITGTTTNLNFAAYSGQCGTLTQIFCSAGFAVSGVLNGLTIGQTYFIRVYSNGSTPQAVDFDLCISTPSTCPTASTVCSLTNYANTTGVANLGQIGCLGTSPNPAYFTIQIATTGPVNYTLTQSTTPGGAPNIDVDYAAWGPFTDQDTACAFIGVQQPFAAPGIGVPVTQQTGCSYSALPTETLNIANAVAGQFYIILITNFSNQAGFISLTQNNANDANHGTTNCCPDAYFTYIPASYCKDPSTPNPLPIIAVGSLGGVFSSTLTPGLVFVDSGTNTGSLTGQIDIMNSAPGNYVITNTVAATATCLEKTKSYTINITAPTTASFTYEAASFCNIISTPQAATLTGDTGGTYSATPNGGLAINVATGAITPSASSPGIYTITYALPGGAACVGSNPTAIVEIIDAPVPTFTQVPPICPGEALADLPTTSVGAVPGITGTWTPAMNNTTTTTYTFTPDAGQCADPATMTISVGSTTPTFTQVAPICPGETMADLPTTSNGPEFVVGTWSPALDNTQTTTYTFTPTSGNCVASATMTIQVLTPSIVPTFNAVAPICPNGILTALPTTSINGITGAWSPALDNTQTTTYTFIPDTGQCGVATTMEIIVNPQLVVTVNNPSFCPGSSAIVTATPAIPGTYNYTWTVPTGVTDPGNVASFSTSTAGTYTVVIDQVNNFCNTDFETPLATGTAPNLFAETLVPCWDTTSADGIIEIWPPGFEGVTAYSGNQLIELNANTPGTLFQDFNVIPGTSISISFAHRGRQGNDVVGVEVGPIGGPYVSLGNFTDGNTAWGLHSVNYTIPMAGGNNYTLRFVSVSSAGGSPSIGNLLDNILISSLSCTSEPTSGVVSIQTLPDPTVTVTQPTCTVQTGTIEVTSPLNAGGLPANLFISEVTDESTGSLSYIEIYNGTGATVDLSNYKLKVYNNGSGTASCDNALAGMLSNNSSWVVAVGSATNVGGVTPNQVFAACGGVNTDDNIRLTSSSDVEIDLWGRTDGVDFTPANQAGYTYRRLATATIPSLTWNAADWDALDPQDYTNVGSYTYLSTYEYSLDSGTYQAGTTFAGVTPGTHTITVHNLATGCYSLPFDVVVDPIVGQLPTVTTITYTTPVCKDSATPEVPNTSAVGFTSGGTYSEVTSTGLSINSTTGEINLTLSTVGFHTVQYEVLFNSTTCQAYGVSTFVVEIKAVTPAVVGFSYNPSTVCKLVGGTMTPIPATGFTTGGTFSSTTGLSIAASTGIVDVAASTAGTYTVTYTVAANAAMCQAANSATYSIEIIAPTTPTVGFHYTAVCSSVTENQMPILDAGFVTGGVFSATNGLDIDPATGEITLGTSTGSYTVTYTLAQNVVLPTCQAANSATATFVVSDPIAITASGDCDGNNFVLTVTGSFDPNTATFSWEDGNGLEIATTQSVIVTNEDTYTVTVSGSGCPNSKDVIVDSVACMIQKGISINGDGKNDTFDLTGFNVTNLSIFNRYGMKVYNKSHYTNEWKGQSDKGDELPDGTYYFVIERENGETKTGWIYVNRAQ